jgi:hypothetical protein
MKERVHMMTPRESFDAAVEMFGSEAALARASRYNQASIWRARKINRPSAEMSKRIELATKGKIRREWLRPDLFLGQDFRRAVAAKIVHKPRGGRNAA